MVSDKQAPGRGPVARNQAIIREGGEQDLAATLVAFLASVTARWSFLERGFLCLRKSRSL